MKERLLSEIRLALKNRADIERRNSSNRFFKSGEEALVYGVKFAEVNNIAKEFAKRIKTNPKEDVFAVCEELWKSKYLEEAVMEKEISNVEKIRGSG